jgi:hypothetical protein
MTPLYTIRYSFTVPCLWSEPCSTVIMEWSPKMQLATTSESSSIFGKRGSPRWICDDCECPGKKHFPDFSTKLPEIVLYGTNFVSGERF